MKNVGVFLIKQVAKAVLNTSTFGLASFAVDAIVDGGESVAKDLWEHWGSKTSEEDRKAAVEEIAKATADELRDAIDVAVLEVAADRPEQQMALKNLLPQLQPNIRRTLRRPNDPLGLTTAKWQKFDSPQTLQPLIPTKPSRFATGQQPLAGSDLKLIELLGIGGFGEVWKASNPFQPRRPPVALKFCLDATAANSLRNEADLLDRIVHEGKHPGIVELLDTHLSAVTPALQYEYVAGGDLADLIKHWSARPVPPSTEDIRESLIDLVETMAFAHHAGIVHRDLKPANILIPATENFEQEAARWRAVAGSSSVQHGYSLSKRFKIADFGIGGIQAEIDHRTRRAHTIGQRSLASFLGSHTPLYASSEQANGEKAHTADDIYALGVIWYQMLTGNMNLGAPTGTKWQVRMTERGLQDCEIELLVWCIESRDDRPQNAVILLEELKRLGAKADPAPPLEPSKREPEPRKFPKPIISPSPHPLISAPLDSFAEEMENATVFAAAQNNKGQRLFDRFQYAEAAKELEEIPVKLRNQHLYQNAVTRRDRLVELEEQIRGLVKDHEYPKLINPVQEALRLFPGRPDFLKFQKLCPDVALRPGTKAGDRTVIQLSGLEIPFRWCPVGTFTMGSPNSEPKRSADENQVSVRLSSGFWLGETVVTQELYKAVTGCDPSHFKGPKRPVESVSWEKATTFCERMSNLLREEGIVSANERVALPTEAQWEYACRAGTRTVYWFGDDAAQLRQFAWFIGNSGSETHPVATHAPNPWGFYDMHGNVWEWCSDWYVEQRISGTSPNGLSPSDDWSLVIRGGSWNSTSVSCRAAVRCKNQRSELNRNLGFRVCLTSGMPS